MSEERLQRYLDDRMDDAERRAFERELLGSEGELREAYDELVVREALARHAGVRHRPRSRRRGARPLWVWPTAGAAAVALVVWFLLWPAPPETPNYRGEGSPTLQLLAPRGSLPEAPELFRWSTQGGAQSYRFELFDGSGDRIFQTTTTDTVLRAEAPTSGSWRVTALDSLGMVSRQSARVDFGVE